MRNIILDFGISRVHFDSRFYEIKESGNFVTVICRSTGKTWRHYFTRKTANRQEVRYWIKREEPPKMRILPKMTHANSNNN